MLGEGLDLPFQHGGGCQGPGVGGVISEDICRTAQGKQTGSRRDGKAEKPALNKAPLVVYYSTGGLAKSRRRRVRLSWQNGALKATRLATDSPGPMLFGKMAKGWPQPGLKPIQSPGKGTFMALLGQNGTERERLAHPWERF